MILGVTGLPGSGKSYFCRKFLTLGCSVVNADHVGHLTLKRRDIVVALTDRFGDSILIDGEIHRPSLGKIAFDQGRVPELNEIIHPVVREEIDRLCKMGKSSRQPVLLEAAILWESGLGKLVDAAVYLETPFECRLSRVKERGWDESELINRERHQDANIKRSNSDWCLRGDMPEQDMNRRVEVFDMALRYAVALGRPERGVWALREALQAIGKE